MVQPVMSSQLVKDQGVKMVVYSESGIGKTMLIATLPRPVMISAEKGSLSLSKENLDRVFGPTGLPYVTDIPVLTIETLQDLEDAYKWCTHPEMQQYYDSIGIDSITEIAEKCLRHFKPLHKDPRKAYGDMQDNVMNVMTQFRDIANKNVYMAAKLGKDKDEVSGQTYWGPSMPGTKLGPQVPYLVDEVFRYQVMSDGQGGKTRVLQTQPGLTDVAKDRSGTLSEYEFPHLGYIINKIKGIQ